MIPSALLYYILKRSKIRQPRKGTNFLSGYGKACYKEDADLLADNRTNGNGKYPYNMGQFGLQLKQTL